MNNVISTKNAELLILTRFLGGLIFGGLAGYGAMLLFAPQSGEKTRTQIGQKSIELQDRATDTYGELLTLSQFDNRKILIGRYEKTKID